MTVVHAMLGNAALAAVLALIAMVIGLACHSPMIRHVAWVIVLLKLVTPPLVHIPLPVLPASWAEPTPGLASPDLVLFSYGATEPSPSSDGVVAVVPTWWQPYWPSGILEWAIAVWAAGSIGWFLWQGRRIVRFRRKVLGAEPAPPEIADAVRRLAAELGIDQPPEAKLAAGIGSPMLWGWGRRGVVLFPRDLLARLSPEARDTLLAHELAHFLRRDHWVRVLEYLATGLYWWHPAVWLARCGIEAAEEECCDAWVVAGLAASPRRYAEALLATVDFEAELRRPCLPPGACAASRSARILRRRLIGIIDARPPRRIRGARIFQVLVLAALLLQPQLRASSREAIAAEPEIALPSQPQPSQVPTVPSTRTSEPRAWATAAAPEGGLLVLARDREVVVRHADGSNYVLGPGRPLALSFAPGGNRLATAGPGPLIRAWDDRGGMIAETRLPAAARAVAYLPDGGSFLALDATGRVTLHDPQTLETLASWYVEGTANSLACSPDGRTIAVSCGSWLGETGCVEIWSIEDRQKVATYPAPMPVGATRFSPDGGTLILGGWNGRVIWQSLADGRILADRPLPKDLVSATAFSPEAGTLPLVPPPEPAPPPVPVPQWELIEGFSTVP